MRIQRYCVQRYWSLDIFFSEPFFLTELGAIVGIKYQIKRLPCVPQMCISDVCLDGGACIGAVAAASPSTVEDNTIDLEQHGKVH